MKERKNIDRLFQEKFKDFEAMPPEDSWANIEAKLDKKKKKRIVPFWWKLSGVAALLVVGFFITKSIYSDGIPTETPIVNQNNLNTKGKTDPADLNKKFLKNNVDVQIDEAVTNETNAENPNQASETATQKAGSESVKNSVATSSDQQKNKAASDENKATQKTMHSTKSAVAEGKSNRSLKNKSNSGNDKTITESELDKQQSQLAQNQKNKASEQNQKQDANGLTDPNNGEKGIAQNNSGKNDKQIQNTINNKNINLDDLKGTINSKEVATKETDKKANDTTSKKSVAKNELEELLNEKEQKLKKESKLNRWQLASNVAPVFLGSVSNGSPIDSTLSRNSKSFNTNVGFGIGVSYAVNQKFSVRTGINKVSVSYDTNDISFFTGIQAKTLSNVRPTANSAMIHVESNNPVTATNNFSPEEGLLPFENAFVHKNSGYLRQEMDYLEMPVEMTYNLLDKKFGIKIIGGFSTFFLQDNNIMLVSDGNDTMLGEAKNLNDVHFSTNLGLGVKYNFLKAFEFNVEPTFKYQLNTYSTGAGNFKPYIFGIYSGVSYKF